MSQVADFDPMENPYRSSATLEPMADDSPEVLESELRAFVGTRSDYYLRKWAPRLEDPKGEVGMNWVAFFLPAFWLGYRKMYAATFIYFGAILSLTLLQELVFVGILGLPAVSPGVGLIVNLATAVVCGLCGNAWYLSHARRAIAAARAQGLQDEHLMVHLARRGGTSLGASFGMVFLGSMAMFVLIMVLAIIGALLQAG